MNKDIKKIHTGIRLFVFLCIVFLFYPIAKAFADLEVKYPTISGHSITASTKLPDYVTYLFYAGMSVGFFAAFVSLAWGGAMYILSPISAEMRSSAKDRIMGAITGLLILLLTYLIISTINPQLNIFNTHGAPATTAPVVIANKPGVYFYGASGCPDTSVNPVTSSVPDLGALKNRLGSLKIVPDDADGITYISILYSNTNFWGKCLYVSPGGSSSSSATCQGTDTAFSSASIYQYDFNPSGDGVYFYRHSCFNDGAYNDVNSLISHCKQTSGGYYEVTNSSINGIYVGHLNDLTFNDVPKDQQDCIEYDKNGKCCTAADDTIGCDKDGRKAPTLGGQNISSIIINGNYVVLLVYFGKSDATSGPWTSCQEFPTVFDASKIGPRQIKWQDIRNTSGTDSSGKSLGAIIPNYVVIIPVQSLVPPANTAPTLTPLGS